MGWNTGWEILQNISIKVYDEIGEEGFNKIAQHIIAPFQGTDIDEGGKDYDWLTKDGKEMEQIFVDAMWENFSPDDILPGDFEGEEDNMCNDEEWAYIKAFYLILESKQWQDKKHMLLKKGKTS